MLIIHSSEGRKGVNFLILQELVILDLQTHTKIMMKHSKCLFNIQRSTFVRVILPHLNN